MSNKKNSLPTVSIIVPVHNDKKNIAKLLHSLLNQNYPNRLYEIIIVDNNSTDGSKEIIKRFPVKLLEERRIQSSYAARNKGIKHAKNEIIALIDSDCIATPQWLKEGTNKLVSGDADLVGGRVEFVYSERKTAAEFYDSFIHMQFEVTIKKQNVSGASNLFVKSFLFDRIGLFPDWLKSGGDFFWTGKATRSGFLLVYSPSAIVKHPTRTLKTLFKKKFRVARGTIPIWINQGKTFRSIVYLTLKNFFPPRLSRIKKLANQIPKKELNNKFLRIWLVSYLCKLSSGLGIFISIYDILNKGFKRRIDH